MAGPGVIAAVLVLQLTSARGVTAVTYQNVPPDVARVSVQAWHDERLPVAVAAGVEHQGDRVIVRAASGRRSLVLLERADGAYLLDGPFWWPSADVERRLDRRWRRTITATSKEPVGEGTTIEWLPGGPERAGEWPKCVRAGERAWTCWGALADESAVIICRASDRMWWSVVSRGAAPNLRSSNWGRLLVVPDTHGGSSELRVRFAHPISQSLQRRLDLRLETAAVPTAHAISVGTGVTWLFGEGVPPDAWMDVRTAHSGPAYVALEEVAAGSPSLPLMLGLDETRPVDGIVVGHHEQLASGALVTMFRLIDPQRSVSDPSHHKPAACPHRGDDRGRQRGVSHRRRGGRG